MQISGGYNDLKHVYFILEKKIKFKFLQQLKRLWQIAIEIL